MIIVASLLRQSLDVTLSSERAEHSSQSLELAPVVATALIRGTVSSSHLGPQVAQTKRKAWQPEECHFTVHIKGFGKWLMA